MIVYEDKDDLRFVHNIASASTLLSSITGQIKNYIVGMFPKNYFKNVFVDTAEASIAANMTMGHNPNMRKVRFPALAITPEISLDNPVDGMDRSLQMTSHNVMMYKDLRRFYKKLIVEPNNLFSVYFSSDYITTNFQFKITIEKYIQNVDLAYYLKSRLPLNMWLYLDDIPLDTELPKTFVKMIEELKKLDLKKAKDLEVLQDYLMMAGVQHGLILKKKNLSTGKDCFFFKHNVNILSLVTDLDAPPSIVRNQQAEDLYTVTFRVQASTWLPSAYIFSLNREKFRQLSQSTVDDIINEPADAMDNGFYSTGLSFNINLNRKQTIEFNNSSGEKRIAHEVAVEQFTFAIDEDKPKTINLFDILADDAKKLHAYMVSNNLEVSDVFQIRVLTKNYDDKSQITLDYDSLTVTVSSEFTEDFFASIYMDRAAEAAIKKAIETDKFYFSDNAMATMAITYEGEVIHVKIKGFKNKYEMYSTDLSKSVRTLTPYGIGYISLVDPVLSNGKKNPRASNYNICVGFDSLGTPIVKAFELYR